MRRVISKLLELGNSVYLGITFMVLIGLYIAIGSGRPDIRAFFECTDLDFFNAWPLKLLMMLLVLNLGIVTFKRIPFTAPRYGVWCVHVGIVVLIAGMARYYSQKVEGTVRIGLGQSADHYYDAAQRALYFRLDDQRAGAHELPSLPRFNAYRAGQGARAQFFLRGSDLHGIQPRMQPKGPAGAEVLERTVSDLLNLPHPLTINITGFWPWAVVQKSFVEDPAGGQQGVRLRMQMPGGHGTDAAQPHAESFDWYLVGSSPSDADRMLAGAEIEHRIGGPQAAELYSIAARQIHQLKVKVKGFEQSLDVEPGKSYDLGSTGYRLTIENYVPDWSMNDTHERVRALVMLVKSPSAEFRRMVLSGKDLQTDFLLKSDHAGPMGARQKAPLDTDLLVFYTTNDPWALTSGQGSEKHTLVSSGDRLLTDFIVSNSSPARVVSCPDGKGTIEIDTAASAGPFMRAMTKASGEPKVKIELQRIDHLRIDETVAVVPPNQRSSDLEQRCVYNVVRAELSMGDWRRSVLVSFTEEAGDTRWQADPIDLPGTPHTLSLTLGKTMLALPARITLQKFDLVPYAGGPAAMGSMMRDFRSTLEVENPETGEKTAAVAQMNSPVYYDGGRWLFFQAQWDPDGQRWTVLGVGNRPGITVMTTGVLMVFGGLLYAFYLKPVIVRRMKRKALSAARQRVPVAAA